MHFHSRKMVGGHGLDPGSAHCNQVPWATSTELSSQVERTRMEARRRWCEGTGHRPGLSDKVS
jgi:hypothetical protein